MTTTQQGRLLLLDLPNEVLALIINNLVRETQSWPNMFNFPEPEYRTSIDNFRQTCRHIRELCEPAFCRRFILENSLASNKMELVLKAHQQRRYYVEAIKARLASPNVDATSAPTTLPHLPNLKRLDIIVKTCEWGLGPDYQPYLNTVASQLKHSPFSELRFCSISLPYASHGRQKQFHIGGLMTSPKLRSLSLQYVDLRGLQEELLESTSTGLESLLLCSCGLDEKTMKAILKVYCVLEHLSVDLPLCNVHEIPAGDTYVTWEFRMLQQLLSSLGNQGLKTTELSFDCCMLIESDEARHSFDLTKLNVLKELTIRTSSIVTEPTRHPSDAKISVCCPTSVFDALPASIEIVKLIMDGYFDLEKLARTLLDAKYNGGGLPKSLVRIDISGDMGGRRFSPKVQQEEDERLLKGIELFMTELALPELRYYLRVDWQWERTITAKRSIGDHNVHGTAYELLDKSIDWWAQRYMAEQPPMTGSKLS
ncbi:hypothetical protein H2200_007230 [Cladophialophora chaetospira]|uniref:F-box domain-containing protein n=1 Tax=Cladophialophora chaetospira TaxID=386627 RepID=A0AA38X7F0_9EURO|nr:hypothetical protein H2200_007230 [Cladophialophora chaetospira]